MNKYVLLIGDGNGAASRGLNGETLYTFKTEANAVDEAIDNCQEEIREMDQFDNYDEYLEDGKEISYHEYFNDCKDPTGGDIWLVAYIENGVLNDQYSLKSIRSGHDGEYTFDSPEDAKLFGLPSHVKDKRHETMDKMLKNLQDGKNPFDGIDDDD